MLQSDFVVRNPYRNHYRNHFGLLYLLFLYTYTIHFPGNVLFYGAFRELATSFHVDLLIISYRSSLWNGTQCAFFLFLFEEIL